MVSWVHAPAARAALERVEAAVLASEGDAHAAELLAAEEAFVVAVVRDLAEHVDRLSWPRTRERAAVAELRHQRWVAEAMGVDEDVLDTLVRAERRLGDALVVPEPTAFRPESGPLLFTGIVRALQATARAGRSLRPAYAELARIYARREA